LKWILDGAFDGDFDALGFSFMAAAYALNSSQLTNWNQFDQLLPTKRFSLTENDIIIIFGSSSSSWTCGVVDPSQAKSCCVI